MALRAVPDHPKFARLKATLNLPKGVALGWLEAIWHFAGKYTPHGNIGKYSDLEIEAWVEWNGESGMLVKGLVDSGWLDRSPVHRLLVHDWPMHADKATKLSVSRSKKPFCSDSVPTVSPQCGVQVAEESTVYGLPVPVPVPVPEPVLPEMVATAVMAELCISTRDLAVALDGVCRAEMNKGRDATELRDSLIAAYREYETAKPKLTYTKSTMKFFGEGDWRNKAGWPWKPGESPPIRRPAKPQEPVVSAREKILNEWRGQDLKEAPGWVKEALA